MTERFRGITMREGVLVEGPRGWGDFCPFEEYDDAVAAVWLATALEAAWLGWPARVRDLVPVNAIVPAVRPERAHELVLRSGCRTAKVKVADTDDSLAADADRVAAVRDALGPGGTSASTRTAAGAWRPPCSRSGCSTRWHAACSTPSSRAPPSPSSRRSGAGRTSRSRRTSRSGAPRTRSPSPARAPPTSPS